MDVRRAGPADRAALGTMLAGLSEATSYFRFQTAIGRPPRASVVDSLLSPHGSAWVAERDGRLVGHAMWAWAHGERPTPTAELAVVVADADQNQGIGSRLFDLAAAHARAAGADDFLLVVSAANDRTVRLVRRCWPAAAVTREGPLISFVVPASRPDVPVQVAEVPAAVSGRPPLPVAGVPALPPPEFAVGN